MSKTKIGDSLWKTAGDLLCHTAEQNAIIQAAKLGVSIDGATLYCTHFPCTICCKDDYKCRYSENSIFTPLSWRFFNKFNKRSWNINRTIRIIIHLYKFFTSMKLLQKKLKKFQKRGLQTKKIMYNRKCGQTTE